jgi:hemerythrin
MLEKTHHDRSYAAFSMNNPSNRRLQPNFVREIFFLGEQKTMERYIAWKSHYSVGDPALDADHQQILQLINKMYEALELSDAAVRLREALDQLVRYTMTHFQREERVMQECGYPDFTDHKAVHDRMRRRTLGLRAHTSLMTNRDLLVFLKDWWTGHIQEQDKQYAPYLHGAAVGG